MSKSIKFFFIIFLLVSTDVKAFEKDAEKFISETTKQAKLIILKKNINDLEKKIQLEELALNVVDVDGLAKYSLGEELKKLNNEQIKEFVSLFRIFFSKNISSKLRDYSDQEVLITASKKFSDNYVLVNSKIISLKDKQEILVDWRVFLINNKLIIRDLVVEGLSLARTQREEFLSIIANKGFDGLIRSLKNYISKN